MSKPALFIPVENQVRELDAKLLLAGFAAERGYSSYVGWKGTIDAEIIDYPRGVYIAKSITSRAVKMFRIIRRLGHRIVAWDEEAVVHYPPDIYYARRCDETALGLTHHLLAWGEDNKILFEAAPHYNGTKIDIVGNPRVDLLRPEFRDYFKAEVAALRDRYGDFILVNTNFGSINGYYPELNVAYEKPDAPGELTLGRGAIGLPRELALDMYAYRRGILDAFRDMVPKLAAAFPDRTLVLRPHPAENRDFWGDVLKHCPNVEVVAEGNVVPWLLACAALVHNGCTTAVESYILERPIVAYGPRSHETFDVPLPNSLSVRCDTVDEVVANVGEALDKGYASTRSPERSATLDRFIAAIDGRFAADRILDSIDSDLSFERVSAMDRMYAQGFGRVRRVIKQLKTRESDGRYSRDFKRQRFPDVTRDDVKRRVEHLARLGGHSGDVRVEQAGDDVFRIAPA
jgi:surface carbohydrate biosynthesis protein